MTKTIGSLPFHSYTHSDSVADNVRRALSRFDLSNVAIASIDPRLSDTAQFCVAYTIPLSQSVNCVIVQAKRAQDMWFAACLVRATDKIDINGVVRQALQARKVSFAAMGNAVSLTRMEYGGITPIGLPDGWQILVDEKVATLPEAVIGSGRRDSKLLVSGDFLSALPNAQVLTLTRLSE